MKKQAGVWLVIALLVLCVGLVYALSTGTPHSAPDISSHLGQASPRLTGPTLAAKPAESLSPGPRQTEAYEVLKPPQIGKKAPDFTAKTAEGKTVHLSDFKGRKNVVMVFYQGSFCHVCGAQLTNLQKHLSDFRTQDAEILAISADDTAHAMQSVGEHGLTFNVVPDANKTIIREYGIGNINKQGIAWPSAFVVDKKGLVQLSYADQDGHRLHSNEILPVLAKITGKPAPPNLGYEE